MGEKDRQTLFPGEVMTAVPRRKCARRANDLDGRTWQRNSISIWSDIDKSPAERRLAHPAMFPTALVERLMECFTTAEDRVILDPFLGSGSTIVAARRMGKVGVGFEVCPEYVKLAQRRIHEEAMLPGMQADQDDEPDTEEVRIIQADARRLGEHLGSNSIDLCVTSPPYWDILSRRRTADGKDTRDYGAADADISRIADYWGFINALCDIFTGVLRVLRPGKYCVVNVMDIRKKDVFYALQRDLARHMVGIGFTYDDLIIWDRRREYNNMRPLGYPSVFRINRAHEFLLIFQKPAKPRKLH